jgi:hypothetical protein
MAKLSNAFLDLYFEKAELLADIYFPLFRILLFFIEKFSIILTNNIPSHKQVRALMVFLYSFDNQCLSLDRLVDTGKKGNLSVEVGVPRAVGSG